MTDLAVSEGDRIARRRALRELVGYFSIAFAITFGLGGAVIFFQPQFEAVFGPLGPPIKSWPYYVAVCAPTMSAVLLSAMSGGVKGVKALFAQLLRPFRPQWALIALLTFPSGLLVLGLAERIFSGAGVSQSIDIHAILAAPLLWFTTAKLVVDPGPWGEETGWRGFALPRLLTLVSPVKAAVILGVIWGLWHAPAFFATGLTQSGQNFGWFLVETPCLSIIMTWIYVNANRNYLVAGIIPHAVTNLMGTAQAYNNIRVEAAVLLAIAISIIFVSGPGLSGFRFTRASQPSRTPPES